VIKRAKKLKIQVFWNSAPQEMINSYRRFVIQWWILGLIATEAEGNLGNNLSVVTE